MSVNMSELIEKMITKKIQGKANELGIEFQVKHSIKDGMDDILLRVKSEMGNPKEGWTDEQLEKYRQMVKKHNEFTEYVSDIVVGKFSNHIRFSYPTRL